MFKIGAVSTVGEFVVLLSLLTAVDTEERSDITAAVGSIGTDRMNSGDTPIPPSQGAVKRRDPRAEPGGNLTDPL